MRMLCWSECINNAPHYRNNGQTGSTQWHRHTPNYVSWAIRSTYHTILKAFPGTAIFGRNMLFDIPDIADWNKGDYRQHQTDHKNWLQSWCQVLVRKNGILRKTYNLYDSEPWTITSVHTNEIKSGLTRKQNIQDKYLESKTIFWKYGNIEHKT